MLFSVYYSILSKRGKKYRLDFDYVQNIPIKGHPVYLTDKCSLSHSGTLYIYSGYIWDGPSGGAPDTTAFMRASLVHDVLYELMRKELLPTSMRKKADEIMLNLAKEDGMTFFYRWWAYLAVRLFAGKYAK
jgi:hypothetical protein